MSESRVPLFPVDSTLDSSKVRQKKEKRVLRLPESVANRLHAVIVAERRQQSVVLDKVISDYLSTTTSEPRPYIPSCYATESVIRVNLMVTRDTINVLEARSLYEGRELQTILLRAVLDYLEASPDDPVKHSVVEPTVGPESGWTGTIDGSESAPEEGSA